MQELQQPSPTGGGRRKFVYYNLNTHKWSVKDCKTGLVKGDHRDIVELFDCALSVGVKGRLRVLDEKRKNVHAGVRGTISDASPDYLYLFFNTALEVGGYLREITYNPYKYDSFVYVDTKEPVKNAKHIIMVKRKVYEVLL